MARSRRGTGNGSSVGPGTEPGDLRRYRDKRDPATTNEPFGAVSTQARQRPTRRGVFVVHQHAATRMHWDLRIEAGGALESFAVPKGPSLVPKEKRLAVHTEPHPLDYLDFEAVIPEGNYGAGAMIVWDRGVIEYPEAPAEDGIRDGKVDFLLFGTKLRGRFALVRTSGRKRGEPRPAQESWLLLKKTDAHSRDEGELVDEAPWSLLSGLAVDELSRARAVFEEVVHRARDLGAPSGDVDGRSLTPMKAAQDGAPLSSPGWIYELKLDGVRLVADKRPDGGVTLSYRTGRQATAVFPEIARAVEALPGDRLVLDGELVTFDAEGRPSFQRLGSRLHAQRGRERRIAREAIPVRYLAFDLLQVGDRDLRRLPLRDRKALLGALVRGKGLVRTLDHIEGDGRPLVAFCTQNGLEGVVAKKADAPYRVGPRRTGDWVKVKCERAEDFVVLGWTAGDGGRGSLGALVVGSRVLGVDGEDPGDGEGAGRYVERGRVGSGFGRDELDAWRERLGAGAADDDEALRARVTLREGVRTRKGTKEVHRVRPEHVVRVRFIGWTEDGALRAPVFAGLRNDADPASCAAGPPPNPEALVLDADSGHDGDGEIELSRGDPAANERTVGAGKRVVHLTNQHKVFWPEDGFTKGDLCRYYEAIAPVMLPHVRDRPITLVRYPDGIHGKNFFQWTPPRGTPEWLETFRLRREDEDGNLGKEVATFLVGDRESLLHVANLGAIPIHQMAFRTGSPDRADFLTMDFDLGEAPFRDAVTLARSLHEILEEIGLPGYPKTSGQTGLHVLVALGEQATFAVARQMADLLGQLLVRRHPTVATMERVKAKRKGRVLVDTGQTGRTRTIVAPYSVRASPGAGVSTPLTWDEVSYALDPRRFNLTTVPDRVSEYGDPMAAMPGRSPDLASAVSALGRLLPGG